MIRSLGLGVALLGACLTTSGWAEDVGEEMDALSCMSRPVQIATLSSPVAGAIKKMAVTEGQAVKAGALLVQLEDSLESLEVRKQYLILYDREILKAAKLNAALQQQMLHSSEALFKETRSISLEDLDKRRLEYKLSVSEVARLEQQEKVESVQYAIARAQVARRQVKAPFAGVVTKRYRQQGEMAEANAHLLELVDVSQGEMVCSLSQQITESLTIGQKIPLTLFNGAKRFSITGQIEFISPVVDPASGLVAVRLLFDNRKHQLRLGVPGYLNLPGVEQGLSME
ncbi:efflux RND transporter periplasmic adaptor subunit [Magnetococcus sp. PR-3]|uniref:efflux RND transporter periplasmic adaptor subunit n=1 Tax=Magnetococcus sp. PR-3 TaxID=3120355 RepID=UPI002FCDFB35